jgi:L-histidine N-alpha-methyltransferase
MPAHAIDLSSCLATPFALDAAKGLGNQSQKSLPSQYLYDELGSILFDAITVLPEYGLTRADARLLRAHAPAVVAAMSSLNLTIAELGSGTGAKTRWILEAAARRQGDVVYHPIDISETAVQQCTTVLESVEGVTVIPQTATYLDGLSQVVSQRRPQETLLVLFLGSTIGNFDWAASRSFLTNIRALLQPCDGLLLGTDLIKPLPQMLAAYDDPTGVTAAFNLNLLARMNRELDARFNLRQFRHEARFNEDESRIEMHLRSTVAQTVRVGALDQEFTFRTGETIWTEGSYKFRRSEIDAMALDTGYTVRGQWTDHEWPFAETLMIAK